MSRHVCTVFAIVRWKALDKINQILLVNAAAIYGVKIRYFVSEEVKYVSCISIWTVNNHVWKSKSGSAQKYFPDGVLTCQLPSSWIISLTNARNWKQAPPPSLNNKRAKLFPLNHNYLCVIFKSVKALWSMREIQSITLTIKHYLRQNKAWNCSQTVSE